MKDADIYFWFGVLVLLLTPVLFWNARRIARQSAASVNWPQVDGQITASEIRDEKSSDKWFHGEYAYAVGDATYKGTITSLGSGETDIEAMRDRYPLGLSLPVHYDPAKPKVSTTQPGARSKPNYWIVGSFVIAGIICLALGMSK